MTQHAAMFCLSPAVALEFVFASKIICLSVCGGKMHLCALLGKFTNVPVGLNLLA